MADQINLGETRGTWIALAAMLGWLGAAGPVMGGTPQADFNGDGYADMAIGAPGEDLGDVADVGVVSVLYGAFRHGLTNVANDLFHQDVPDVQGVAEAGDFFGAALAAGDFDGNGYTDLAVGVPGEDVGVVEDAGAINVFYGIDYIVGEITGGLTTNLNWLWHQDVGSVEGLVERGDAFGSALAAGDFDGNGTDDLAIGVPREDVSSISDAGAVNVLYGSREFGIRATNNQLWHQDTPGVDDWAETGDGFGSVLATGDFNGDGFVDLAIGSPREDDGLGYDAGAVNILYGSPTGLRMDGDQVLRGIASALSPFDSGPELFGSCLAAGDFDGDGYADLAVGEPGRFNQATFTIGAVHVFYGNEAGLSEEPGALLAPSSIEMEDDFESPSNFGASCTSGNFDSDFAEKPVDDLVVGAPDARVSGRDRAGIAVVFFGVRGDSIALGRAEVWHQESADIEGDAKPNDGFGAALGSGDFNNDGVGDLVVGVPHDRVPLTIGSGSDGPGEMNVIYGAGGGLSALGNQLWDQGSLGHGLVPESGDRFGAAVP